MKSYAVTANATRANRAAVAENVETRLKTDRFEHKRRKLFLDALVANVGVVFDRHKKCKAEEYVNEVTLWQLVIESSEAVRMTDLHLALWLKNGTITNHCHGSGRDWEDAQIPRSDGTTPIQAARQQHHRYTP